jgi:hypothetical protein
MLAGQLEQFHEKNVIQTMQCCPPFSELDTMVGMVGHKATGAQLMPLQAIQTPHCALNENYLSKSRSDQIKSRERQYQVLT